MKKQILRKKQAAAFLKRTENMDNKVSQGLSYLYSLAWDAFYGMIIRSEYDISLGQESDTLSCPC